MYRAPLFIWEAKETLFKIYIANVQIAAETWPTVGCHMTHCAVPTKPEIARISHSVVHQHTSYVQWRTRSHFKWQTVRLLSRDVVTTPGGSDDRRICVRIPTRARDFSLLQNVETGSRAHQVSEPMGIGGSVSGGKRAAP
jgi:hypothetical protein